MENTYNKAKEIVESLQSIFLDDKNDFSSIRNVFITGSFVRGDWLNMSSDLDIQVLFYQNSLPDIQEKEIFKLQKIIEYKFGNPPFPSHAMYTQFGLDWSLNDYLPYDTKDIMDISPFSLYNIFYFDFFRNRKLIYGDDFTHLLPKEIDVKQLVKPAIDYFLGRITQENMDNHEIKSAHIVYKVAIILQIYFGEKTLDKWKILYLYLQNVPEFSLKYVGEMIIRNYIGSYYPDRKPLFFKNQIYIDYVKAVRSLLENN